MSSTIRNLGKCFGFDSVSLSSDYAAFRLRLLLCVCLRGSVASGNRGTARRLLLCISISIDPASTLHVNQILYWLKMQVHANAGGNAYEYPLRGRIKGAT